MSDVDYLNGILSETGFHIYDSHQIEECEKCYAQAPLGVFRAGLCASCAPPFKPQRINGKKIVDYLMEEYDKNKI